MTKTNVRAILLKLDLKDDRMTTETTATRKGKLTRQAILSRAVQIASREGLEKLTIGRLAKDLNMSKSGLFSHFGSKESLQISTIEMASEIYRNEVIRPALRASKGLARLWSICQHFSAYAQQEVFSGGCFFATVTSEYKSCPGLIRDMLALRMRDWLSFLASIIAEAQESGEMNQDIDPSQLAFELQSLLMGTNWFYQLFEEENIVPTGLEAIRQRLLQLSSPEAHALLDLPEHAVRKENHEAQQ